MLRPSIIAHTGEYHDQNKQWTIPQKARYRNLVAVTVEYTRNTSNGNVQKGCGITVGWKAEGRYWGQRRSFIYAVRCTKVKNITHTLEHRQVIQWLASSVEGTRAEITKQYIPMVTNSIATAGTRQCHASPTPTIMATERPPSARFGGGR